MTSPQTRVKTRVLSAVKRCEIRGAIIRRVAVYVVGVFARPKFTTECVAKYQARPGFPFAVTLANPPAAIGEVGMRLTAGAIRYAQVVVAYVADVLAVHPPVLAVGASGNGCGFAAAAHAEAGRIGRCGSLNAWTSRAYERASQCYHAVILQRAGR